MSLLDAIAGRQSSRVAAATDRYAEILESGDESRAEELLELAGMLGKSEANIASDSKVLMGFNHCLRLHAAGEAKVGQFKAAANAAEKFRAETEALLASRLETQRQLDQEESDLGIPVATASRQLEHMLEAKKKTS